ncbi:MAG: hypothetical protein DWQ19_09130 [Crenarchaeota archaeon]|nr:MAG: hypothetical protein DWQ19_09130 [Thermoproteota archaeon]
MLIQVKQADIVVANDQRLNSVSNLAECCPVYFAACRAFKTQEILISSDKIRVIGENSVKNYLLPQFVIDKIKIYDESMVMTPFEFEV